MFVTLGNGQAVEGKLELEHVKIDVFAFDKIPSPTQDAGNVKMKKSTKVFGVIANLRGLIVQIKGCITW